MPPSAIRGRLIKASAGSGVTTLIPPSHPRSNLYISPPSAFTPIVARAWSTTHSLSTTPPPSPLLTCLPRLHPPHQPRPSPWSWTLGSAARPLSTPSPSGRASPPHHTPSGSICALTPSVISKNPRPAILCMNRLSETRSSDQMRTKGRARVNLPLPLHHQSCPP